MGFVGGANSGISTKFYQVGWGVTARLCDYCNSAPALLFRRNDSVYLCMSCDSNTHIASKDGSTHERVWMCEVCERAPASVTCKADAAMLCVTCDRDIHSANPLASRHERIPVNPFYDTAASVVKATAASSVVHVDQCGGHDQYLTDTLISSNPMVSKDCFDATDAKLVDLLFTDHDDFGDFDSPEAQFHQQLCSATDGVVPVQTVKLQMPPELPERSSEKQFYIDFTKSSFGSQNHSYTPQSLTNSVSSASLDVGLVPEGSSMSEISCPFGTNADSGGISSGNMASQMGGMDREARVLRYRERRKNRKFEKTIRYASRKAYADTRPRIKGRFAKRSELEESNVKQIFSSDSDVDFFLENRYGVVPTF